jgi:hypothetical protein
MNIKLVLTTIIFIATCTAAWSAPLTTYIEEFSVSGSGNPEEMRATIRNLLLSRLAGEKITTVSKPEGAEIKVTGSYLLSGSVFSIDAAAANSSGTIIVRAFTQGKSPDELIPAVGTLAKTLSEGIEKGVALMATVPATATPPDIITPTRTVPAATGQAIHKMDGALLGLAIGRIFSGGERELFLVGSHTLHYYRQGGNLKLMTTIPYKVHEKVLAVDTADLDNNTIPEIYVTVINGEELVSQVWTVEGATLKQIAGPLPYFFRAVTSADGTKKLYAQQMSGTADFFGDVAELVKSGDSFTLKNPVKLPKQGYLYNFNLLRGLKAELNPIIADQSGYLRVFSASGDELWKSSEEYSGSETHFKRSDLGSLRSSDSGYRQVFLDQRIVGKTNSELLVAKNSGSWFLFNKHSYTKNNIYCFTWDGANLSEKWHTRQSDYYLADFAYDEASHELLTLEVVNKEEGVFDKGASRLSIKKIE